MARGGQHVRPAQEAGADPDQRLNAEGVQQTVILNSTAYGCATINGSGAPGIIMVADDQIAICLEPGTCGAGRADNVAPNPATNASAQNRVPLGAHISGGCRCT